MTEAKDATDAASGLFDRSRAIRSARIPAGAKLVLEAISDCGDSCFLKQQTMAIKTGLGLRAVSKWISWLKDAGIVESTRTGRSSHYSVAWGVLASAVDAHERAHQIRTLMRIRCARACASDTNVDAHLMRTSVRIASDSINGFINGSENGHPNEGAVEKVSFENTAKDICHEWYQRTHRLPSMRPEREIGVVARWLGEHGEHRVRKAIEDSIAWVRDQNKGVRYLAGDLARMEQRLIAERDQIQKRRESDVRQLEQRALERAKDAQFRDEQRRKHEHWDSLSLEEREGRIKATRAGMPNSSFINDWFVEMQSIHEAWEDLLASTKG